MAQIADLIREHTVHSALYTDPQIFAHEMERIYGQNWVYVAHESEIPKRGDFLRRTLGLEPVIVSRGPDGIHVVANRCAHRGNLLCQAERGNRRVFSCLYHGWVFSPAGDLLDVPFPVGSDADRSKLHLRRARVESYRGFIFATFNAEAVPLAQYLGHAKAALDRAANMSPAGEIELSGTWIKHLFHSNWKMLSENEADGYHVGFVHDSFARSIKIEGKYGNVLAGDEKKHVAIARELGNGHAELDYAPTYSKPLSWLGVAAERYPTYVEAMNQAYGTERATELMRAGPPHTFIFPNLFLAETCLVMIQPLAVGQTVNWHTPMYLKGVPEEMNRRILRQGEVALGPSAFLTADDAVIAERQWRALAGSPGWLDLSRGLNRETREPGGIVTSHYTDEVGNRGFWRHYRQVMSAVPAAAAA
jgi:phenylpropionate dioxygenase-like ring-hydroxylating dioxygenase large terminal subunit